MKNKLRQLREGNDHPCCSCSQWTSQRRQQQLGHGRQDLYKFTGGKEYEEHSLLLFFMVGGGN